MELIHICMWITGKVTAKKCKYCENQEVCLLYESSFVILNPYEQRKTILQALAGIKCNTTIRHSLRSAYPLWEIYRLTEFHVDAKPMGKAPSLTPTEKIELPEFYMDRETDSTTISSMSWKIGRAHV